MIMSDHGGRRMFKNISLNQWLLERGYLKLKERRNDDSSFKRVLSRMGLSIENMSEFLIKLGAPDWFRRKIPSKLKLALPKRDIGYLDINLKKTKAYSYGCLGKIVINLKGREPYGIVKPGEEYEETIKQLMRDLYELRDPETNERVVEKIYRKEELYHGKYVERAPDLIVVWKEGYADSVGGFHKPIIKESNNSGDHSLEGILLMYGKNIRKSEIYNAEIVDLAPTILYLMGLAIPADMDGKVLVDNIKEEYLKKRPPSFTEKKSQKKSITSERNRIKKRLNSFKRKK
jgi:predicted AlkP superfamily phosphohydrolase/phosphomutase